LKLSIIILNYNVRYFLELCISSVQAAISTIDAEIIVVDNNSNDESCNMIKQLFPEVTLIENKENFGFSKGNNQGVTVAKGEYICILNPDTVVAEDSFEKLLEFASLQENIGIIGCKLIDGTGQFLPESKRNIPTVKVAANKIFGNSKKYYANHLNQGETGKVDILVGAFMLLKKEVYQEVNGFDEDYFMFGEDIDLSYRILNLGYDNYYFSDTKIIHFKGESTLKNKYYAKGFYNAMQLFYKKHFITNILFKGLVLVGIKLAFIFRTKPTVNPQSIERYVIIFGELPVKLASMLTKPIELNPDLKSIKNNTEIILDANALSYKKIIDTVSDATINTKATFKILPKNSNFMIGSNSSKSRGEIICFE